MPQMQAIIWGDSVFILLGIKLHRTLPTLTPVTKVVEVVMSEIQRVCFWRRTK